MGNYLESKYEELRDWTKRKLGQADPATMSTAGAKAAAGGMMASGKASDIPQEVLRKETIKTAEQAKKFLGGSILLIDAGYEGLKQHDLTAASNTLFSGALGMIAGEIGGPWADMVVQYKAGQALNAVSNYTRQHDDVFIPAVQQEVRDEEAQSLVQDSLSYGNIQDTADSNPNYHVNEVFDASGKRQIGYYVYVKNPATNDRVITLLTMNHTVARQIIFNPDKGASISGSGIHITRDFQTGKVTATLDWEPGETFLLNPDGSVKDQGHDSTFRLSANPFGSMVVSRGGDNYLVKPGANVVKEGMHGENIVVSNANGDGLPNLLLGQLYAYAFDFQKVGKKVVTHPFGNGDDAEIVPDVFMEQGGLNTVDNWLNKHYPGWAPIPSDTPYQPGNAEKSGSQPGQQENSAPGKSSAAPALGVADSARSVASAKAGVGVSRSMGFIYGGSGTANTSPGGTKTTTASGSMAGAAKQASMQADNSAGSSSEMLLSKTAEQFHSAASAVASALSLGNLSFNPDGSGSTTTTNPDGTKSTTPFNSMVGAVKLADIFGTLPEVVGANIGKFVLHYTAMANQQAPQPQDQLDVASGVAADVAAATTSAPPADAGTQASNAAASADGAAGQSPDTGGDASGNAGTASGQSSPMTQENQDAGIQPQDNADAEEALA